MEPHRIENRKIALPCCDVSAVQPVSVAIFSRNESCKLSRAVGRVYRIGIFRSRRYSIGPMRLGCLTLQYQQQKSPHLLRNRDTNPQKIGSARSIPGIFLQKHEIAEFCRKMQILSHCPTGTRGQTGLRLQQPYGLFTPLVDGHSFRIVSASHWSEKPAACYLSARHDSKNSLIYLPLILFCFWPPFHTGNCACGDGITRHQLCNLLSCA